MEEALGHTPEDDDSPKRRKRAKAGVVKSLHQDMLMDLVQKDYVLFAPKSSRGLKFDYPELSDKDKSPEFVGVRDTDMLFVWAWACASSPFVAIEPRAKKMELCCRYAYPIDQWERKTRDFDLHFPDDISRAIERMGKYNFAARVEEYVAIRIAREHLRQGGQGAGLLGARTTSTSWLRTCPRPLDGSRRSGRSYPSSPRKG